MMTAKKLNSRRDVTFGHTRANSVCGLCFSRITESESDPTFLINFKAENRIERNVIVLCCVLMQALLAGQAAAAELNVKAVMSPKEQMRLEFADGSGHFVLMVRREGKADGAGPLAGAGVTEYGWHDIEPGVAGDPRGYLVFTAPGGDVAYIKWRVRAVFLPGADGKPKLLDNGFWEIAGGTGRFRGAKGAGTLHIKAVSPTDREYSLTGEIGN